MIKKYVFFLFSMHCLDYFPVCTYIVVMME